MNNYCFIQKSVIPLPYKIETQIVNVNFYTMETIITMLVGKIEDQKLWVEDMKLAVEEYAQNTLDCMIPSTQETFDRMLDTLYETRAALKNMRKSLEYALVANGIQLTPDQRQTPELYA